MSGYVAALKYLDHELCMGIGDLSSARKMVQLSLRKLRSTQKILCGTVTADASGGSKGVGPHQVDAVKNGNARSLV